MARYDTLFWCEGEPEVLGPDTCWFETREHAPDIFTLRAEVFGPYPPGSSNDPIWYFGGDSLRFWSVKVEVDTTLSSAIFGVPSDTTEAERDSVRTVFRVLPDSASSRVSFVHSPAGQRASFWHCVTNAAGDTVRLMRELDIGSLATVGTEGEDRWRYTKEWSPRDDEGEWLDPADGPFESEILMKWEQEEAGREGIWRWVWDRHRCRGLRLRLIVYGGNGASEIDRAFTRLTGSGVYVPLNADHDNGTIQDDREALIHGGFLDNDLVRMKLLLETEGGEWNGQGGMSATIRLACEGGRVRVWRGNAGGDTNLLATPDDTEEYVWDLAEDATGVPGFIGTRAEFLAERGNLWIEGYRGSGQVKDAAIRVGIQSGTYEYVDYGMFTVTRVDTLIEPVVNHRFVIQTMPPQMPEVIVEARVGPAGEEDEFRYRYRVCARAHPERLLEYEDAPAGYDHPTPRESEWLEEASWTMPFSGAAEPDSFFGGRFDSLKVWAKPMYGAVEGHVLERGIGRVWGQEATGWRCWIVGDALQRDHVVEYLNQMIVDGLPANEQERLMLEAIAQTETEFTHFAPHTGGMYDSTSVVRYPVESRDHGYGVMQLTPAPTRVEIWNWQANIDRALGGHVRPCWTAGDNWLNSHPENPGGITDEMRRLETYARYRGGVNVGNEAPRTYHEWYDEGSPPRWLRRPVLCGCNNCDTNGQYITPQGASDCFPSIVCYADEARRNQGP